jgi:hypothetical protein
MDPPRRAKVLIIGTFHFDDAGHDTYKPKHPIDTMSAQRQREIAQLVDTLAKFHPTKVALEFDPPLEPKFNERYAGYLAGTYELKANEIYQIGFRLARESGLKKVNGIDGDSRFFEPQIDLDKYAKEHGQEALIDDPIVARFMKLYEYDDELKTRVSLRDFLLYINSPQRFRLGHGHYLSGTFHAGSGNDYAGADNLTGWWYSRNIRIYENVHRLVESPDDRIVILIGAGHLPILEHLLEAAPDVELVTLRDVL